METYRKELDKIRDTIAKFYTVKFASSEQEYETNKLNKEQIGQLLIRIKEARDLSGPEQKHLVTEALKLLAENTGCVEDSEIAEEILDHLFFEVKVINEIEIDQFYEFSANRRWE
jgi:tRNA U34 5-carboxymethylaminomethyl modifying GTPase MnmE/TrmE